ncbi:hypothetical protein BH24ACT5_BH24ACT5_27180 [soil metagenome]
MARLLTHARNRGVGRSLIEAAEARCREREIEQVGMGVAADNSDAARLYERLGYRDSGLRYVTNYQHLDNGGTPRETSERNRFLIKGLDVTRPVVRGRGGQRRVGEDEL